MYSTGTAFYVRKIHFALTMALIIGAPAGCGRGMFISRALSEVKGGTPQLTVIRDPGPAALLEYRHARIDPVANEMGPQIPSYASRIIRDAFVKELRKEPTVFSFAAGDPRTTLVIRIRVIHYDSAGSISKVMGGFSQLICRVELVDGATGKIVGQGNCAGFSKAIARSGIDELSDASAEALRKWLTRKIESEDDE